MLTTSVTHAAEMLYINLTEDDDLYQLRSASIIDAPPDLIINTLLDYNNFHRLSGGIKETRYLDPDPDGTPVGYTLVKSCILFMCKQINKTERVTLATENEIILDVDPSRSDFELMHSRWSVKQKDGKTVLTFDMDMIPGFWVPPLIGTWAIKRKLESTAMNMARRMETMAKTGIPLSEFKIK
ncbi:MAG: SRPBCC family protein [Pseudomonadota bacterium]|nr:SRPBCC family protein [Pseudomonadota bacterium]